MHVTPSGADSDSPPSSLVDQAEDSGNDPRGHERCPHGGEVPGGHGIASVAAIRRQSLSSPGNGDADAAGFGGSHQLGGHRGPGAALAGRRGEREVLRHQSAAGRVVVFPLEHVAGPGQVGDDGGVLRSVMPWLTAISRSRAPGRAQCAEVRAR
jgi:hypothetical protein